MNLTKQAKWQENYKINPELGVEVIPPHLLKLSSIILFSFQFIRSKEFQNNIHKMKYFRNEQNHNMNVLSYVFWEAKGSIERINNKVTDT